MTIFVWIKKQFINTHSMARIISRESIAKANYRVSSGHSCISGSDSQNMRANVQTSFGTKNIVVSKSKVEEAAAAALRNAIK